jgi:uncharacterized protein (TIGR01777 family)
MQNRSRILVSGSHGLIGSALVLQLEKLGHQVIRLTRSKEPRENEITWNPEAGVIAQAELEGFEAIIHLAGENIASKRWTEEQKQKLFMSRVRDTWLLSKAISRLSQKPKTFISASACGFYGDRGEERLTEASSKGEGFLASVCEKWEDAILSLEKDGVRLVHPRFGIALSSNGGVLAKMLPIFRLGLGAKLGSGKQYMSWIALDDLACALVHILDHEEIKGAVNFCSPNPVPQEVFAKTLAKVLHRPAFLWLPAPLLRLIFGEMADELLLTSQNVYPEVLLKSGFHFEHPTLEEALSSLLFGVR